MNNTSKDVSINIVQSTQKSRLNDINDKKSKHTKIQVRNKGKLKSNVNKPLLNALPNTTKHEIFHNQNEQTARTPEGKIRSKEHTSKELKKSYGYLSGVDADACENNKFENNKSKNNKLRILPNNDVDHNLSHSTSNQEVDERIESFENSNISQRENSLHATVQPTEEFHKCSRVLAIGNAKQNFEILNYGIIKFNEMPRLETFECLMNLSEVNNKVIESNEKEIYSKNLAKVNIKTSMIKNDTAFNYACVIIILYAIVSDCVRNIHLFFNRLLKHNLRINSYHSDDQWPFCPKSRNVTKPEAFQGGAWRWWMTIKIPTTQSFEHKHTYFHCI